MPPWLEVTDDRTKSRKKALGVFCCFEPAHFLLSPSRRLVRMLGSIVASFVLPMLHAGQGFTVRRPIPLQLIRDDHARHVEQPFEQLAENSLRRFFVASALLEDIEHIALLVYRSP